MQRESGKRAARREARGHRQKKGTSPVRPENRTRPLPHAGAGEAPSRAGPQGPVARNALPRIEFMPTTASQTPNTQGDARQSDALTGPLRFTPAPMSPLRRMPSSQSTRRHSPASRNSNSCVPPIPGAACSPALERRPSRAALRETKVEPARNGSSSEPDRRQEPARRQCRTSRTGVNIPQRTGKVRSCGLIANRGEAAGKPGGSVAERRAPRRLSRPEWSRASRASRRAGPACGPGPRRIPSRPAALRRRPPRTRRARRV
jgi:hypothetical protein